MCLGIPGQIVELNDGRAELARVDVSGVQRTINVQLLEDEPLEVGSWVLIHVGFAMSIIDEDEAAASMEVLATLGEAYTEEMDALVMSRIEDV